MNPKSLRFSVRAATIAAAILVTLTATAFAAMTLRRPHEVAQQVGDPALSAAFQGPDAIDINRSQTAGGYTFTLLGVVSGEGLQSLPYASNANADRTYAVVAIQKADGSPMQTDEPLDPPLYMTPLVKGQKPWVLNAHTLHGGHLETQALDGVVYRLIECDNVEAFADRGVYMGICESYGACTNADFLFDEATGEIAPAPSANISVLFDLPLDPAKADPAKAEAVLEGLFR